jgi:hypothetical protein
LEEAKEYMRNQGIDNCPVIGSNPIDTSLLAKKELHFYAVASGSEPGVYLQYQ